MRHALIAFGFAVLLPVGARAAAPTCALLDPEKAPRVALLEAKLLADSSATWVERAGVDKVLQEQKLQALFSPQGVGERVKLGKLLKADVLVLVRPIKEPQPALEVVVSETGGGLRLAVAPVPVTANPDADVIALAAAVRAGIKKYGEKIKEVVAVPPFVSQDLTTENNHLKAAYPKLAEQIALARPGVVVVELAEAEALAREIALTAPGERLDRPLPVYLLGEYRFDGTGPERVVTLKIRAERGGKLVGKRLDTKVKPEEVSAALRDWAARTLDDISGVTVAVAVPATEAKQLAARAGEFRRLGNGAETVALLEAALLLDPKNIDLHADAIAAIQFYTDENWRYPDHDVERVGRAVRAHLRGLEHLETLVDLGGDLTRYRTVTGVSLTWGFLRFNNHRLDTHVKTMPACRALIVQAQREQRETLLRIIPKVAKQGKRAEQTLIEAAIAYLPLREKYELLERIILQLQDLPDATARTVRYCMLSSRTLYPQRGPEFERFLDRLAANENQQIRAAGDGLKKQLAADLARPLQADQPPPLDSSAPRYVTFQPIKLACPGDKQADLETEIVTLVAAGPGADVVATGGTLYVMKEKGKLRRVWSAKVVAGFGQFVLSFDGRYVWASTIDRKGRNPLLLVIDPVSEKVWDVNGTHGVPERTAAEGFDPRVTLHARTVPLAPGRVCVAGSLGGRAWVGIATLDPKDGPQVKVFHEAKELVDTTTPQPAVDPKYAFAPTYMFPMRIRPKAGGAEETRVILGRTAQGNAALSVTPLLLDPERQSVGLFPAQLAPLLQAGERAIAVADGAVYYREIGIAVGTGTQPFTRVTVPDGASEKIGKDLPRGTFQFIHHEGQLYITIERVWYPQKERGGPPDTTRRQEWWAYDPIAKRLLELSPDAPRVQSLATSSHYGLVTLGGEAVGYKATLHAVTVGKLPK